jgi:hypothetical protein
LALPTHSRNASLLLMLQRVESVLKVFVLRSNGTKLKFKHVQKVRSKVSSKKVRKKCQISTGFLKLQCSKALQLKGLVRTTSVHARALVDMVRAAGGEERRRLCDSKQF